MVSARRGPQIPPRRNLHLLPDDQFLKEFQWLNGTPRGVIENSELMDLMLPVLRNDFQVAESYVSGTPDPLPCPIIAFGGDKDFEVELAHLAAWQSVAGGDFRLHMLYDDHFFINSGQYELVNLIAAELQRLMT